MNKTEPITQEISLDPDNWAEMRALGHRMLDDMFDHLNTIQSKPTWKPIPDLVKSEFNKPLSEVGEGPGKTYQDFQQFVLPYSVSNIHPRFWGWVKGTGTLFGMLSEMLAAGLNINSAGFELSSAYVELQVLSWCKALLNYPPEATGILLSGGSAANLIGLTVARNVKVGFDIKKLGLQGDRPPFTVYASQETHNSVDKAIELLGLGDTALRKIPVKQDYSIDVDALKRTIIEDRAKGLRPICIVGNAGTVNTGAFDDLNALADICEDENLWFHIDGAFGAWATLTPSFQHLVNGMERADSLAFDLHKWMYMQYEVGCCLIRHPEEHKKTFTVGGTYLNPMERGFAGGPIRWNDHGFQLSRGFRALKVWMSLKEHGAAKFRRLIQQNVDQARYLASLVNESSNLELVAPVPLNLVCFRFVQAGKSETELNALNQEILFQLQEKGIAVPSSTILHGKFAIRVAITNHRSRKEDFKLLADEVVRLGLELSK